jgi:phosphoglucomutase
MDIGEISALLDSPALSNQEWQELSAIEDDDKEIESRFRAFGIRHGRPQGVMGMGLNRMNVQWCGTPRRLLRRSSRQRDKKPWSRALSCAATADKQQGICAGSRVRHGRQWIKVRIFEDLRPTPELSFAIGIRGRFGDNITARPQSKEYNGYKVIGPTGRMPPRHAKAISDRWKKLISLPGCEDGL